MKFDLCLPFDTDDPEFARGCEVGLVYAHLGMDPSPLTFTMRARNAEMILRLAEMCHRSVKVEELSDDWLAVEFSEVQS